jgi:hypothetical protein
LSIGQYAKDSNYIISTLFQHIREHVANSAHRPHTLYLQADNAAGEGKNRWILGFCALLILWGLFECVDLSFLPPGHTHEDVDQDFSKISIFWSIDVFSMNQLEQLMHKYIPGIVHNFLTYYINNFLLLDLELKWQHTVYDWQSWLNPYLFKIEGHKAPYVFHFTRCTETGYVKMQSFAEHPIKPQPNAGEIILYRIPPGVPQRLQSQLLSEETKKDTLSLCSVCIIFFFLNII